MYEVHVNLRLYLFILTVDFTIKWFLNILHCVLPCLFSYMCDNVFLKIRNRIWNWFVSVKHLTAAGGCVKVNQWWARWGILFIIFICSRLMANRQSIIHYFSFKNHILYILSKLLCFVLFTLWFLCKMCFMRHTFGSEHATKIYWFHIFNGSQFIRQP